MIIRAIIAMLLMALTPMAAAAADLTTYYEKSEYLETPRYDDTVDYCERLAKASRWVEYTTFGVSPQGRELPLLIVDKDRQFTPKKLKRQNKVVLLVQAAIHSGESDGKDAGLMLIRDIAVDKKYDGILDHVTLLFVPIFSVDGHERFGPYNRINQNGPAEMGWRVTAQNLNLNRDYLKADAPEMQAWLALWNEWQPDFFIDCHATDGADYQYVLTWILELWGNMDPVLTQWTRDVYLADMTTALAGYGYDFFPYVYLMKWPDPRGGMKSWTSPPRFSSGYVALCNRPGMTIETHMMKDYKTRVTGTYDVLKETMLLLNQQYRSLQQAVAAADRFVTSPEFRATPFPLVFEPDSNGVEIDFKGVRYDSEVSDLTGGQWYQFSDEPETFKIRYLDKQTVKTTTQLPEAYIIPPEWSNVIDRLDWHGVPYTRLEQARTITVASYRFSNVVWTQTPFEGHHTLTFDMDDIEQTRTYPPGSVVVSMHSDKARVIAHMLEPQGPDSYLFWGYFDTIFEQKEYAESYVMEKMARDMLANDPQLARDFEEMKQNTEGFAGNQRWIVNWFYTRSPYGDDRINIYPIGKIFDEDILSSL